ncbi:MAG: protein-methionine-sulfoxide reductase heme-binding subunit MsrQ [Gammaproteobacteria bacterium]|jgi:sulfoxide reductase heme-binding subunit YedZ|nr:protein-methionine-sulfoxide reductase heme-binding subunit MsrQ [Gammaproteobacteria bacterium]
MSFPSRTQVRWIIKPLWFAACLAPFVWMCLLAFGLAGDGLGPDPIEATQDFVGIWALRLLLATLALTPLRQLTGWLWLFNLRRMTGLFALFYASLHFLNYIGPDQGLDLAAIIEDITERTFITVGAVALGGLLLLGITSTQGWQRRLRRNWQRLHRFVYIAAGLAVWHFWWQVKSDYTEPLVYALILAALLAARPLLRWRASAARHAGATAVKSAE